MGCDAVTPPLRPKRARSSLGAATVEYSAHRPLTPVCRGCHLPLVRSDRACPRCLAAVPWSLDQPHPGAAVEAEVAA